MFELEKEIDNWKRTLRRSRNMEEADMAELESHVRDEIARLVGEGRDERAAFLAAVEDPAAARALESEYGKVRRMVTGRPAWHPARFMPSLAWSYLKIAVRKMRRQKGHSIINIVGLAFGIACSILILYWVRDELNYDGFHEKADRLFRINKVYEIGTKTESNPMTPFPLAKAIRENFAEIADATAMTRITGLLKFGDKAFFERRIGVTDTFFFKMFTFPFVKGDPGSALAEPGSVVITEAVAAKYFGESDPLGQTLILDQTKPFKVSGVIRDIPANSDFRYDLFVAAAGVVDKEAYENWGSHFYVTFALLRPDADPGGAATRLSVLIQERLPREKISLTLQPITKIHLYSPDGSEAGMKYVYFFSAIAAFILIIACINYINLATARSEKRAKEVGLRKVVGARRPQIARQFFGESLLTTAVSLAVAFVLLLFLGGIFAGITGKSLRLASFRPDFVIGLVLIVGFASLASGIYPALVLSSFEPGRALREGVGRGRGNATLRKVLVVVQFSLSIMLLIGTGTISGQLRYMQRTDLGFDADDVLYLRMNAAVQKNYDPFRAELLKGGEIIGVARTSELPMEIWSITRGVRWEGKTTPGGAAFGFTSFDHDTVGLLGLEIARGRSFSRQFPSDEAGYLFNEKAIEVMGMADPVGKPFALGENSKGTILGVVKNFHHLPLTNAIEPLVVVFNPDYHYYVLVKIRPGDVKGALGRLEAVWKTFAPDFPFEYRFLDERFDATYAQEVRAGKICRYFVVIAIFISCLGLLGLASFTAEQKTKEIGIRKTLGAATAGIVILLTKQFVKWVVFSNLIAWPVAYLAMRGWLNNFAFRISIGLSIFFLSGLAALAIAVLTVGYQAVKAARANPVDSLRYE